MSNNPLSSRAEKALAMLEAGAMFRHALEHDAYTGRDQFKTRLISKGRVIKGYGAATLDELRSMLRVVGGGTSVSTYYGLAAVHAAAAPSQF